MQIKDFLSRVHTTVIQVFHLFLYFSFFSFYFFHFFHSVSFSLSFFTHFVIKFANKPNYSVFCGAVVESALQLLKTDRPTQC